MPKKYLVTGGSGFIGSALVRALVRRGDTVRAFDDNSRGTASNLSDLFEGSAKGLEILTGDIRRLEEVERAVDGVDAVCHLAAVNGTKNFYSKPELVLEVSVKGMLNVMDACRRHKVRDLVVMSSSEVYQTAPIVPTPETVPLLIPDAQNARYSYGAGKIISEMLALHSGNAFDNIRIVRPHNVYGPAMGFDHVVPEITQRIFELPPKASPSPLPIQGTGKETRAFVFISDMIEGFLCALDRGAHNGIYHVGNAEETPISELVQAIAKAMHRQVTPVAGKLSSGGTLRRCPDITKIRALGFSPRVSLQEGIEATVAWYVNYFTNSGLKKSHAG